MIERFLSMPSDFTYDELVSLLKRFGYQEDNKGKTSGSRVEFKRDRSSTSIVFHKPHNSSTIKLYVLKRVLNDLRNDGVML